MHVKERLHPAPQAPGVRMLAVVVRVLAVVVRMLAVVMRMRRFRGAVMVIVMAVRVGKQKPLIGIQRPGARLHFVPGAGRFMQLVFAILYI